MLDFWVVEVDYGGYLIERDILAVPIVFDSKKDSPVQGEYGAKFRLYQHGCRQNHCPINTTRAL